MTDDKEKSSSNNNVGGDKKIDVFHLGSNDSPGNIITPIQAIRTAVRAKRKFGFLDGSVKKPEENDAKLDDWYTVHSMLVAWLMNTIESSIRSTLSFYEDARELWEALERRFCVVNGTRICQLKTSLAECKQGKTESVASYFGRLSKIFDELSMYVKLPKCKCPGCTCSGCRCGLETQYQTLLHEDHLQWFLVGLEGAYASVRSQILNQNPLPSLDRAYQSIAQEERLRAALKEDREPVMTFKVQSDTRGKSKLNDNSDKFCAHCNREGHDESTYFQIHGFPDWWGDRPRGGRGPGRGGRGGRGNMIAGRGRGGNTGSMTSRINKATVSTSTAQQQTQGHKFGTAEQSGLSNVTPEQRQL
ncbi:hypothetical protein RND81_03G096700 [Saponaria officinalis]|uniref:Retrotransposon gag domain-containing protein n=1 Tax=Saponaria officinalis TaxID=3572 RepID=A0AAW1M4Z8_SAPOF